MSGGERARLSLLKMMLSGANTLVLDEPTNHLDIESKEVFEEALLEFPGTCIIVSHDRYFLNRIPTRILELTETGLVNYLGKYDYYVEKKQELIEYGKKYVESLSQKQESAPDSATQRKLQKQQEAEERRLNRKKDELEKEIQRLEEEIAATEESLCNPEIMTDHQRLTELSNRLTELKEKLDVSYEGWLELQE